MSEERYVPRDRRVLAVTGYSGTGKTTISKHIATEHGFMVAEGSSLIRQVAAETGENLNTRADYERAFRAVQKVKGTAWLSESMLTSTGCDVLQTGLRAEHDFMNIKSAGGFVIALVCPPEVCLERMDISNAKNPRTLEEYIAHQSIENSPDEHGYGSHTAWCVANADYLIDTSKPSAVSLAEVDEIINSQHWSS